jgi:PD-(D/E)XK endonuclease
VPLTDAVASYAARMNPKAKGEISEAVVLAHLVKRGFAVLLPFGNNQRYDMIVDEDGQLIRVQVKTGWYSEGCVVFSAFSTNGFTGAHTTYAGQIDVFMVYCPELGTIYRVPIGDACTSYTYLRVDPPRNKQRKRVRWAKDYELT